MLICEFLGALGAMYWKGQGTKQNVEAALNCFKQASERGNVYAQGCLVAHYYTRKLYKRAVELAKM